MVFVLKDFYSSEDVRSIQHLPVPLNIAYSLWGEKSVVPSVFTLVVLTQIPLLWLLISKENYHLSFSTCKMGFMVSQNDMLTVMSQPCERDGNILQFLVY